MDVQETEPNADTTPDPMKAHQDKLLTEAKQAKARARELEARLAEFEAKEAEKAEADAIARGEFDKIQKTLRDEANTYKSRYEAEVVGNALTSALIEAKVAGPYMEAAKALLKAQGAGVDKEGKPVLGDRALVDAVKEWAESDAGKHFVAAPNSSGGGASGGGAATITKDQFKAMTLDQRAKIAKENPNLFEALSA